jgi:hypothetical protein
MQMTPRINTSKVWRLAATETTHIARELRLAWFLCKEGKLVGTVECRNLNTCRADASESWRSSARHATRRRNARVARLLLPWPWAGTCSIWAAASDLGSEDTSRNQVECSQQDADHAARQE